MKSKKQCCICRKKFIPTNKNAETRQCCKECIKIFNEEIKTMGKYMKIKLSKYEIDYLTMILEQKIEDYEDSNSDPCFLPNGSFYQHNAIQDLYSKLIILTKLEEDE